MRVPLDETSHAERHREFSRWYQGWRDYLESKPIEPPRAWSPHSRDLYFQGAEAAKRERDEPPIY